MTKYLNTCRGRTLKLGGRLQEGYSRDVAGEALDARGETGGESVEVGDEIVDPSRET